jgi:hypothetical protein
MLLRTLVVKIVSQYDDKGFEQAEKDVDKLGDEAAKTERQVESLDRELDQAGRAAAKTGKAAATAGRQIDRAGDQAAKAGRKVGRLSGLMDKASAALASIGPALAAAGAAAIIEGVGRAVEFVGDETARLDKIAKDAQKRGFGVEEYQQLDHVATLTGTDIEKLSKGVNNLNVQLDAVARGGGGPAKEALDELGISFRDLRGLDPTEQLQVISRALEDNVPTAAGRARVAFKLMGEEGRELIPLFNSGADAIGEMVDSTGRLFTREELARAEAYQDALANLKKTTSDIKAGFAISAAPALQGFVELMQQAIPVVIEGVERIGQALAPAIERLQKAIEPLTGGEGRLFLLYLEGVAKTAEIMAQALGFVIDKIAALIEWGARLLQWGAEVADMFETRWPRAAAAVESAFNAILHPLDTARSIIEGIFDFLRDSGVEVDRIVSRVRQIRASLPGGGSGQAAEEAQPTATPSTAAGAAAQAQARTRAREARIRAEIAEAERVRQAQAQAQAQARPRRRRGGGRGGGSRAATQAAQPGLLDQLGLAGPGSVMENRPPPQVLTIVIAPVIKLIETLEQNFSAPRDAAERGEFAAAGEQARDAVAAGLEQLQQLIEDQYRLKGRALQQAAGGGQALRGAS